MAATNDDEPPEPSEDQRREIARWAHVWMCAAVLTLEQLEATCNDEEPAASVGRRDALAMVLVNAIRNVHRGAKFVLPDGSHHLRDWGKEQSALSDLRDRFEHFDAYLRGTGRMQNLDLQGAVGMDVSSAGGGPGGHTITVFVLEADGSKTYVIKTRTAVDSARKLARATMKSAGLDDERHDQSCRCC